MTSQEWDQRYAAPALVWSAEPNRFLVAEVDGVRAGRAFDLRCGPGTQRDLAGGAGLGGHRSRLLARTEGHRGPQNPEVLFTADDIERELPGVLIERAERVLRPVTVDGREVNAIHALVRANRPVGATITTRCDSPRHRWGEAVLACDLLSISSNACPAPQPEAR